MAHKDMTIKLHYETNLYSFWGDDDIKEIVLDEEGIDVALKIIAAHYIHSIEIK